MSKNRLPTWLPGLALGLLVLAATALLAADKTPGADEWKYDSVYLKNGAKLQGLVLEQTASHVLLKRISRRTGSPTIVITLALNPAEVRRVELLDPKDRDILLKRLQALAKERELLAAQLKLLDPSAWTDTTSGEVSELPLLKTKWPADPKGSALEFTSVRFKLVSNAPEEVTRLAALVLELNYAAYSQALPPRVNSDKPTLVLMTASLPDYQTLVKDQGRNFFNPAFYDPDKNQIVCFSDLQKISEERDRVRSFNKAKKAEWAEYEAELVKAYKARAKVPTELLAQVKEALDKIASTKKGNDEKFEKVKLRLMQRLSHEAFHAYLITYVYPEKDGELPRWFNEGLGQIFEPAIFEAGERRIGHADPERLTALKQALKKETLPDLADVLRSGRKQFQVAHASEQQASDRYYLASWALAFHLTFEKKMLGTKAMDDYVRALKRGTDPLLAFRDLLGQPLPDMEKDYMQYLRKLRPDGTVSKAMP